MCQWPRTQVARVAGSASRSLVMRYTTSVVFLPFLVTVRRSCATWAAPWNSIQAGASAALIVRRARRPWPVVTDDTEGTAAQGSFFSCRYSVGVLALAVIT